MEFKPSQEFIAFATRGAMKKGEWMPCPKCGADKTTYLSRTGKAGGVVIFAFLFLGLTLLSIFILPFLTPIFLGLTVLGPILMLLMSSGKPYECTRCHFRWTFEEAEALAEQNESEGSATETKTSF